MNPDSANLLAQLRDIHAAPDVSWWPPAPGWWLLALLALMVLLWLVRRALAERRRRLRRRRLLEHLDRLQETTDPAGQPQAWLAAVNALLKLVALQAFPGQQVARLEGHAWTSFLADTGLAGEEALAALGDDLYRPRPEVDVAAVSAAARNWIEHHG